MTHIPAGKPCIVLSTGSSDSHTWNLVYLDLFLTEHGFNVVNLGPCTPDDVVITCVRAVSPDAIVVSSVNGHGHIDGERLARKLRADSVARDIPAVIGGKLGISGQRQHELGGTLLEAGFNIVFDDTSHPQELVTFLRDLANRQYEQVRAA